MLRWFNFVTVVLFAFTVWMAWRSHPWGKGAFALPVMLLISILVGTSGVALWPTGMSYSRNWTKVLPRVTLLLCMTFVLGQLAATYTTWAR